MFTKHIKLRINIINVRTRNLSTEGRNNVCVWWANIYFILSKHNCDKISWFLNTALI